MKPGGALADRPIGPQILISGASQRVIDNDGWYANAPMSAYQDQVPEYVLGTDWTQPPAYDVAYADAVPEPALETAVADPGDFVAPVEIPEQPRLAKAHVPSQDGDILAGMHDGGPQVIYVSSTSDEDDSQAS